MFKPSPVIPDAKTGVPIGVNFLGTAQSIVFGGVANYVVFDDVTFGKSTPGIPEPATWAMLLMGAAGVSFPVTRGLEAVWGYEPSFEAMRELIAEHFAYDRSLATDDLVQLRFEASRQPGFHESYHAMFPAPYQRHLDALATPDAEIAKIKSPTLLIHGREDKVVPLSASLRMFELLPNADLHVFGHCGHWTMIERRDDFNALVMRFLTASVAA